MLWCNADQLLEKNTKESSAKICCVSTWMIQFHALFGLYWSLYVMWFAVWISMTCAAVHVDIYFLLMLCCSHCLFWGFSDLSELFWRPRCTTDETKCQIHLLYFAYHTLTGWFASFQEVLRRRAGLIGCGEVPLPPVAEVEVVEVVVVAAIGSQRWKPSRICRLLPAGQAAEVKLPALL